MARANASFVRRWTALCRRVFAHERRKLFSTYWSRVLLMLNGHTMNPVSGGTVIPVWHSAVISIGINSGAVSFHLESGTRGMICYMCGT